MKFQSFAFVALSLAACSTSAGTGDQVITGRIDQATFASPVTAVRAYVGTQRIDEAAVASDGSFALSVPATTNARIELVTAAPSRLVFPRSDGRVDAAFTIRAGGGTFDLGAVRHLQAGSTFSFHSESDESTECHDGVDANGDVCVDDDDENSGKCEDNSGPGNAEDGGGGEGDGGHHDGADDGAAEDEPSDSATAEHNFPADGCNASDDDGSDDGSDDDGSDDGSDDHGSDAGSDGSDA